jgi:DNA replication protein DnaC
VKTSEQRLAIPGPRAEQAQPAGAALLRLGTAPRAVDPAYRPGNPAYDAAEAAQLEQRRLAWEREEAGKARSFLAACGVREEQLQALLDRGPLQPNTARDAVAKILAGEGRFLGLLLGGVGAGKTVAACEAFLSLKRPFEAEWGEGWRWGRPGVFIKARKLATLSQYGEGRELFERVARAPMLVVDEVGGETVPFKGLLDDLVDDRYASHLPTFLTSNLTAEDAKDEQGRITPGFKTLYGERTVDRIRQYGIVAECAEASFRTRRAP